MKFSKTLLLNGATAVLMALLTWIVGVDWTQYVSANTAMIILAVANFALRFVTDSPLFPKTASK